MSATISPSIKFEMKKKEEREKRNEEARSLLEDEPGEKEKDMIIQSFSS